MDRCISFLEEHFLTLLVLTAITIFVIVAAVKQFGYHWIKAAFSVITPFLLLVIYGTLSAWHTSSASTTVVSSLGNWFTMIRKKTVETILYSAVLLLAAAFLWGAVVLYSIFDTYYPPPYWPIGDLFALLGCIMVTIWYKKHYKKNNVLMGVVAGLIVFWVSASFIDMAYLLTRSTPIQNQPRPALTVPDKKIGVALSGGGYRAAILHAGVLDTLESLGVKPTHLATVSGGSILGSFYAKGGTPQQFKQLMIGKRFNLRRDLANIVTSVKLATPMKLPFVKFELWPWHRYNRTSAQADALDRLFAKGVTLQSLNNDPFLMIAMTDLVTGQGVSAMKEGLLISPRPQPGNALKGGGLPVETKKAYMINGSEGAISNMPLSTFVAASGAFPLAFPAVSFSMKDKQGFELTVDWIQVIPKHFDKLVTTLLEESKKVLDENRKNIKSVQRQMSPSQANDLENALLRAVLRNEIERCIDTFLNTSTLNDRFKKKQTEELFRLGQYLVYLRWQIIREHLAMPS